MIPPEKGLVSIIIPTYNHEKYIVDAVKSCLDQTYKNYEVIIVDDGSTDNTKTVLEPYINQGNVNYIFQQNKKLAGARNTGLKHAKGEYLQFLDADDLIHPQKLEKQVEFLERNQDIFGVYCDTTHFKNCLGKENISERKFNVYTGDIYRELINGNFISVLSMLIRRENIFFDETLTACEDWDYWLRLSYMGKRFGYIDESLCYVRIHESNMSRQTKTMHNYDLIVLDKLEKNGAHLSEVYYAKFFRLLLMKDIRFVIYLIKSIIGDRNNIKRFYYLVSKRLKKWLSN